MDIPDDLFRRAKSTASLEGMSMKNFLLEAVQRELTRYESRRPARKRIELPLIRSKAPGSLKLTAETIAEVLDQEDAGVSSGH